MQNGTHTQRHSHTPLYGKGTDEECKDSGYVVKEDILNNINKSSKKRACEQLYEGERVIKMYGRGGEVSGEQMAGKKSEKERMKMENGNMQPDHLKLMSSMQIFP